MTNEGNHSSVLTAASVSNCWYHEGHATSSRYHCSATETLTSHTLICWLAATSLNVWVINVHSLLNVVFLETFTTNTLLLPVWKMYLRKSVSVMS